MSLMNPDDKILVAGAGGFIGGHLVAGCVSRVTRTSARSTCKPLDEWYQVFRRRREHAGST